MTGPDGDGMVMLVGRRVVAWTVAAVVTVALVVGGLLVAGGSREESPAVLPALDLGAAGVAADATGAAAGGGAAAPAIEPAIEPAPAPGNASGRVGGAPQPWPPVTYRLAGPLPTLPDRARAWRVGDEPGAGRVEALAAALGLAGRPTVGPEGWTVRAGNRALTVNRLAGAPFTYGIGLFGACVARSDAVPDRPGRIPGRPAAAGQPEAGPGCLDPDTSVSNKPETPARPVELPGPERAEQVARDLASRAGMDLDGAEVSVTGAGAVRLVSIAPAVGGAPTSGFGWTVGVGAEGRVQHASGYLATPEPADSYPLIGVEEGFERLRRVPPFGPILRAQAAAAEDVPCPPGGKLPCVAKPAPAWVATVTGVRLGLQLAPTVPKGDRPADLAYLLPAYLFDLRGGWTDVGPVIAVPDRYLTR